MKFKGLLIALILLVGLIACADTSKNDKEPVKTAEDIKTLVNNYSVRNKSAQNASTTSHELIVTEEDGSETVYSLPEDEFFVSIAPFISETHPCTNHSLTGCQGELVNETFDIYIEDLDGNVIYDQSTQSPANGFIDLWLPRDKKYNVQIKHNGKIAQSELATYEGDPTCITTMQLENN